MIATLIYRLFLKFINDIILPIPYYSNVRLHFKQGWAVFLYVC